MAKNSGKASGTSRIKFIMFDAEIADDQLQSVTQAITNALRGPAQAPKRLAPSPAQLNGSNGAAAEHDDEPDLFDHADEAEAAVDVTPAAPKKKAQRRVAPKPNMILIDTDSEPPLSSLVDPKSNHRRYLMIAAWLHDHRATPVITQDHIYSCYRLLGWPTDIGDFAQPLRELKHKQYFSTPERGKYAINQLGLHKAKEAE
ncbi:hypothetical protein JQ557_18115 [Bradyrhizobium sp. U87765 SZCCT0131]|uniref:hypothetical protein n=1 Tax=unclassified Bradyrhizobium TaxID=2631580 RepID=UPI001BAB993A|nr:MULTISPECIES: hypothetical protein [unclassified Bradyrhizobium]MBR1219929.1 hypothetical protein [Bradyrhizobium sp. U87765 SZCCT0131]MBR1263615.1 hypothetical protein [Bradyrhizobium sp. U87765 SZCCT0134]MBR1309184.1 hypothetical protein [Bradyrhizobium sp. U87765 SZCCT0110]MBR1323947.1 hypothetical protein [Bradyrhizobium sp. U87765 SZCCT0109]MBR1349499.1 hypothetical protein [Bradyrhizobium sp. U87765 SZCCT0048]